MKKKAMHYLKLATTLFLREYLIKHFPNVLQRLIAEHGYPDLISRSGVEYIGRVYGSNLRINANSKYAVDRNATVKHFNGDPFEGILSLDLKDWIMLDIGANIGAYSIGAIAAGAKKVFAIEPGPFFSKLQSNIEFNNLSHVILPVRVGLAFERGKMYWHEDRNNPGNAHLLRNFSDLDTSKLNTKLSTDRVEVSVLPLDELVNEMSIDHVDFIKIDVEGMEWEVIKSGEKFIARDCPIVLAETHRVASDMMRYDCLTPLFHFFYQRGYKSYSFVDGRFDEFIYPNFSLDTFFIKNN